jgi:hypothetical protein
MGLLGREVSECATSARAASVIYGVRRAAQTPSVHDWRLL